MLDIAAVWVPLVATLLTTSSEGWKPSHIFDEGDECPLPNGTLGRCWRRQLCPSAYKGRTLITSRCGFVGRFPVVCCGQKLRSEEACDSYRETKTILFGITNGIVAEDEEFPHMANLGYYQPGFKETRWLCGGTLISTRFVLTAAHCVLHLNDNRILKVVRLGQNDITEEKMRQALDFQILKHYEPKGYNHNLKNPRKDLSLLLLNKTVPYSEAINPACLYTRGDIPGGQMIITGWGTTDSKGRIMSENLKKAFVTRLSHSQCPRDLEMDDSVICAANFKENMDTCVGDSGGPIQVQEDDSKRMFYVVGVTSYGQSNCGGSTATIYTSVFTYLHWIESIVWKDYL